jgi:large subunit ribosomal protein L13
MKTKAIKQSEIERTWWVADAEGKTLGRFASRIAQILRGKHKPYFTPHMDMGDCVVVINAEKIRVSGNKEEKKTYFRHTGYPGGGITTTLKHLRRTHPERVIEHAVKGMLPHNRLGRRLFRHLKVYAGPDHPHQAQQPKPLEL